MSYDPPLKVAAEAVASYLAEQESSMLELLRRLVEINSYTANTKGCDAVAEILREALVEAGLEVSVQSLPGAGNMLLGRSLARSRQERQALFVGHLDTVFAPEMGFDGYVEDGDKVFGPGVYDMKGGLVAALYALKALEHAGLLDELPVTFLINSDEETGSAVSRGLILAEAQKSAFGMVFEGAGLENEVVVERKGIAVYHVDITGKAGHAGKIIGPKPSANVELARLTLDLEALNDPSKGLLVNVGVVGGGSTSNAVPASARAVVDTRYNDPESGRELAGAIFDRLERSETPGVTLEGRVVSGRPPMPASEASLELLEYAREAGKALDVEISGESRGGVSDANYLASSGVPVLDGFGPRGGRDHSPDEFMIKSSLAQRAALAALTLWLGWRAFKDREQD